MDDCGVLSWSVAAMTVMLLMTMGGAVIYSYSSHLFIVAIVTISRLLRLVLVVRMLSTMVMVFMMMMMMTCTTSLMPLETGDDVGVACRVVGANEDQEEMKPAS